MKTKAPKKETPHLVIELPKSLSLSSKATPPEAWLQWSDFRSIPAPKHLVARLRPFYLSSKGLQVVSKPTSVLTLEQAVKKFGPTVSVSYVSRFDTSMPQLKLANREQHVSYAKAIEALKAWFTQTVEKEIQRKTKLLIQEIAGLESELKACRESLVSHQVRFTDLDVKTLSVYGNH